MSQAARAPSSLALSSRLIGALVTRDGLAPATLAARIVEVGWGSMGFVAVIGGFIGMNIALQGHVTLERVGALSLLGEFVARAALREVAPLAVVAFTAAKVGSQIAATISAMKDRGELEALETMGVDPLARVAAPWLWALVIAVPWLVVLGDVAAAGSATFIAIHQLGMSGGAFWQGLLGASAVRDLGVGMLKGGVIGLGVGLIAAVVGFRARPGVEGVAGATHRAAVYSFLTATTGNYLISRLAYAA